MPRRTVLWLAPVTLAAVACGGQASRHRLEARFRERVESRRAVALELEEAIERVGDVASPFEAQPGDAELILAQVRVREPEAGAKDLGSFQDRVPGVRFFLGVGNEAKGWVGMPHTPEYVADEEAIFVGARVMGAIVLDYLEREAGS